MIKSRIVTDAGELAALRAEWESLLERSATPEPTLAPAWVLAWWKVFGGVDGRALRVVLFYDGARLVGLAPLLERRHAYRPGIPFRRLELMGTGEDEADEVCSDYVGVLAERGAEPAVADALAASLARGEAGDWDELSMPSMNGESSMPVLLARALREKGAAATTEVTGFCPYIPLPKTWDEYLAALPTSRRYLVRRSLRDLEAWADGTLRVERATTPEELARGRGVLESLHAERWSADGSEGAFASKRFSAFHDALTPELLASGSLDLRWMTVRGEPVAAAYNIVSRGKLYFYQSGRKLDVPKGVRPGIAIHADAIRDAIARGLREYDFLAGAARYKLDLALATRPVVALRAARPSVVESARRAADLAIDHARIVRDGVRKLFAGA